MSDSTRSRWLNPPPDGRRFALAMAIGLALEAGAVLALITVSAVQPPPTETPTVVKLSIIAPAPPKPPTPKPRAVPPPPKPVPPPPPQPVAPPLPLPPPPPIPRPEQHVLRHYVKPPIQTPPPLVQPPTPPVPPAPAPPPAPAAPSAGELDIFKAQMREAVQAVVNSVYPQAAQMANETGTADVTFTYTDGVVTDIALARSTGYPLLDQAALAAARMAHYPLPPAGLSQDYSVSVPVEFQLAAPDVSGD